ncbi:hypothetical protein C1O66_01775 [Paucibacter aquatile]|uniref:DUF502 domain-containing protein n=1 Tax=Kinneretia aquatilis TaxID=2070761 RepID=A0A2N8L358_9BURK|nr:MULTISPECIES: DUF502 domain-containing protein [Roseateles]PND40141.1 hypothetical protein C1O66_01775 [Paucibacter aquatile]WIV98991.1 DUF502 domain-containing protein [Paucibacter aquatile]
MPTPAPFAAQARRHVLRTFVTGFLTVLPLVATLVLLGWVMSLLMDYLGPKSVLGHALGRLGLRLTESPLAAYLIGLGLVLVFVYLLGLLVETQLQRRVKALLETLIARIPVISTVYDLLKRMIEMVSTRDEAGVRAMAPVWCHFGGIKPEGGVLVLGLLSSPEPVDIGGNAYLAVLVPTAPVPVGGGLLYLPRDWVRPAEIGMDGLSSLYVSMGVTTPEVLGSGKKAR